MLLFFYQDKSDDDINKMSEMEHLVTRSKGKQKAPQATCTKRRQEVIELPTKKKVKSSKK